MAMQRKTDTTGAGAAPRNTRTATPIQSTPQDYRNAYEKFSQSQSVTQARPGAKKPAAPNYNDNKFASRSQSIKKGH